MEVFCGKCLRLALDVSRYPVESDAHLIMHVRDIGGRNPAEIQINVHARQTSFAKSQCVSYLAAVIGLSHDAFLGTKQSKGLASPSTRAESAGA